MKLFFSKLFPLIALLNASIIFPQEAPPFEEYPTFLEWQTACNQGISGKYFLLTRKQFKTIIKNFLTLMDQQLNNKNKWCDNDLSICDKLLDYNNSTFYTQKILLPEGAKVAFHGDLHGNVQALNSYLASLAQKGYLDSQNAFHIIDENFYLIFLGDYVDRGKFGMETIYTLARLKLENPDHVFMVRGNHEDVALNSNYGFIRELKKKCGRVTPKLLELIDNLYARLPVALYAGIGEKTNKDYILCCHGGWEVGYDPLPLLQASPSITYHAFDTLERENIMSQLPLMIQCELSHLPHTERKNLKYIDQKNLGFLWNDFIVTDDTEVVQYDIGRGWKLGKPLIDSLRKKFSDNDIHICAIFRAHQHGDKDLFDMMLKNGIAKLWNPSKKSSKNNLWDGIVCTFLVAPYTGYSNTFDSWGELEVGKSFNTSKLTVHRNVTDVGDTT